jgi:hypothetical protein
VVVMVAPLPRVVVVVSPLEPDELARRGGCCDCDGVIE